LWGLPLAAVTPLLALLGNIVMIRLSVDSRWRLSAYNWQFSAGILFAMAGIFGTMFVHILTNAARQAEGPLCNGLYGWLTVVFDVDIVLCSAAVGLGCWYSVRMIRD
jgi:hypothetical protein